LRAAVDHGDVVHWMRTSHELTAGVNDQIRMGRQIDDSVTVHRFIRAHMQVRGIGVQLPRRLFWMVVKVTGLAGGDDVRTEADLFRAASRFFRPLARDEVIGSLAVGEILRDRGEELRCPSLQEEDLVRVADTQQRLAAGDRLIDDAVEFLAAVRALGDAEALALEINEGLG